MAKKKKAQHGKNHGRQSKSKLRSNRNNKVEDTSEYTNEISNKNKPEDQQIDYSSFNIDPEDAEATAALEFLQHSFDFDDAPVKRSKTQDKSPNPVKNSKGKERKADSLNRSENKTPHGLFFVFSLLLSLTFYSLPLLNNFSTGDTSANLYSGFAMMKGAVPYNDFYGNGGILFYFINMLGNVLGNTWILWIFEILSLYLSAVYSYQIAFKSTERKRVSITTSIIVIFTETILLMGGDKPLEFALPLVLWLVKFILDYMNRLIPDEKFIIYGVIAITSILVAPVTVVFDLFIFIALLIFNFSNKIFGRAIYQFLCSILGLLFVLAPLGYYGLNKQIIWKAYEQMFLFPIYNLGIDSSSWSRIITYALVILLTGMMMPGLHRLKTIFKNTKKRPMGAMLMTANFIILVLICFYKTFDLSLLVATLPSYVIMLSEFLSDYHSRRNPKSSPLNTFFSRNLYLPLLALMSFVAYTVYTGLENTDYRSQEESLARSITDNTYAKDKIFYYADDSNLYMEAKRLAGVARVPDYYPKVIKDNFDADIDLGQLKYIVIDKNAKGYLDFKSLVNKVYDRDKKLGTDNLEVYTFDKDSSKNMTKIEGFIKKDDTNSSSTDASSDFSPEAPAPSYSADLYDESTTDDYQEEDQSEVVTSDYVSPDAGDSVDYQVNGNQVVTNN